MQDNYQLKQPINSTQTFDSSLQGLKDRLRCPRVYTWVVFGLNFLGIFNFTRYSTASLLLSIVGCILSFLVALYVTLSANTGDVRKYNLALYICIGFLAFICLEYIIFCILLYPTIEERAREEYKEQQEFIENAVLIGKISLIVISALVIGIDAITLCVLYYYKKEFDGLTRSSDQLTAPPEV